MKKILYIFAALVLLASCQKDAGVQASEEAVVTYDVKAPIEFEIKGAGQGTGQGVGQGNAINALWYGVYHKKDDTYRYMSDMSDFVQVTDINDISVPITLFKDQEYKIIFVAQHIEPVTSADGTTTNRYTYNINSDGDMSLNPEALITDTEQLDAFDYWEQLDAFVYWEKTGVIQNDSKKNVTLSRPLAQINISTTATPPDTINVTVAGAAASYNIFSGAYSAPADTPLSFRGLTCSGSDLATLYILPAGNSVDLTLSKYYEGDTIPVEMTVSSVSVAPNYKTNVKGNI
jgi:hypothetical protein